MKLKVDLRTEYEDKYFQQASLFHALDHIKEKVQLGQKSESVDYRSKGYGMDWELIMDNEEKDNN